MLSDLMGGIADVAIGIGILAAMFEILKLKRKLRSLEQQLQDFDVIPGSHDAADKL